jgi:hypothetical protein
MTIYDYSVISGFSIVPAALVGAFRFNRTDESFRPLLYVIWLGALNEFVSSFLLFSKHTNNLNSNIFVLLDFMLIYNLFRNWGIHQKRTFLYKILGSLVIIVWITDNLILSNLHTLNSLYRFCYSFVLIFLTIDQLNYVLITVPRKVVLNPRFIICICLLAFYVYKVFLEVIYVTELEFSRVLSTRVYFVYLSINLLCNLFFILALYRIRRHPRLQIPY